MSSLKFKHFRKELAQLCVDHRVTIDSDEPVHVCDIDITEMHIYEREQFQALPYEMVDDTKSFFGKQNDRFN